MTALELGIRVGADASNAIEVEILSLDGTRHSGVGAMPRDKLAALGIRSALADNSAVGLANAAAAYRDLLWATLSIAVDQVIPFADTPVQVTIGGGPALHDYVWEALRWHDQGVLPTTVVRVPDPAFDLAERGEPPVLYGAELVWLGSRVHGEVDVPRFQVAGVVLPTLLDPGSALSAGDMATDASAEDFRALLRRDDTGLRIIHVDAHGVSRIRPGTVGLVDAVFSLALRGEAAPVELDDHELSAMLVASGCELFVTNACFGAQQRGAAELPFPGQLVGSGVRVVVAAREPLRASSATHFFSHFYAELGTGAEVAAAFQRAIANAVDALRVAHHPEAPTSDRLAREILQPVLWAAGPADARLSLRDRQPGAPEAPVACRELLSLGALDGVIATALSRLEDDANAGVVGTFEAVAGFDGDIDVLQHAVAAARAIWQAGSEHDRRPRQYRLRLLSDAERQALVWPRFTGTNVELQLLSTIVPGELGVLNELRDRCDGLAAVALMETLAWGERPTEQEAAEGLIANLIELRSMLAGDLEDAPPELLTWMAGAGFALPALQPATS